jgi:hypothetical protein
MELLLFIVLMKLIFEKAWDLSVGANEPLPGIRT